jgi:hypothetical protein
MKTLYHFTAREYLPAILTTGLNKGDVPTSATTGVNGVWLTSLPNPRGHGLSAGGVLSDGDRTMHFNLFGEMPPPGSRYPNKLAVRITIGELPEPSRLVRWSRWGPKNCAPGWYDSLCRANVPTTGRGGYISHPFHWRLS